MDKASYDILSNMHLPDISLISLQEFEHRNSELLSAKQNRNSLEYYFTCTPSLILYILENFQDVDIITYLDADLFFFSAPDQIYREIGKHSIAIIEHRFPQEIKYLEKYGIYNVGWLSFRRDNNSLNCLLWWRERCIEWCYDRVENGRFGDQKYLDDWPDRFQGVIVLRHKGANLALWNINNYSIRLDKSGICVDEQPLIFFHFHGLEQINNWLYRPDFEKYKVKLNKFILRRIYGVYIRELLDIARQGPPLLKKAWPISSHRFKTIDVQTSQPVSMPRLLVRRFRKFLFMSKRIICREYILVVNGHVI